MVIQVLPKEKQLELDHDFEILIEAIRDRDYKVIGNFYVKHNIDPTTHPLAMVISRLVAPKNADENSQ